MYLLNNNIITSVNEREDSLFECGEVRAIRPPNEDIPSEIQDGVYTLEMRLKYTKTEYLFVCKQHTTGKKELIGSNVGTHSHQGDAIAAMLRAKYKVVRIYKDGEEIEINFKQSFKYEQ